MSQDSQKQSESYQQTNPARMLSIPEEERSEMMIERMRSYPRGVRVAAVQQLLLGKLPAEVAEAMNIPIGTICSWKQDELAKRGYGKRFARKLKTRGAPQEPQAPPPPPPAPVVAPRSYAQPTDEVLFLRQQNADLLALLLGRNK